MYFEIPSEFLSSQSFHIQIESFISSFPIFTPFISFSYLIAEARIFCVLLNKSVEKTYPCFGLDLIGEIVYDFIMKCDASCRFFVDVFYQVEVILFLIC